MGTTRGMGVAARITYHIKILFIHITFVPLSVMKKSDKIINGEVIDVFLTPEEEKSISSAIDQMAVSYAKREGIVFDENISTEDLYQLIKQHSVNKKI